MPFPIGAAIGAGAGIIGNLLSNNSIKKQNQASQAWADRNYDKQRQHNLEDWNRQNVYNSPQEQMKRFQEAGLNKNLIYGQGSAGNAQPVGKAQQQNAQFQPNEYQGIAESPLTFLNTVYDLQQKKANIALTQAQKETEYEKMWLTHTNRNLGDQKHNEMLRLYNARQEMGNYYHDFNKEEVRKMKLTNEGQTYLNRMNKVQAEIQETLQGFGMGKGSPLGAIISQALLKAL